MGRYERMGFHRSCRGSGDGMYAKGTRRNTGSPIAVILAVSGSTGNSREPGRAVWGGVEVRSTEEAG